MKNIDKYLSLLGEEADGLLLTSRYSRHYGAEFDIAEGIAIVTASGCRYFTDPRYIESAQMNIKGFEVLVVDREHSYTQRLNDAIADFGVTKLGYEEHYLTVEEFRDFEQKLNASLVPMHKKIYGFRAVKEDWELDRMRKAQSIADKAFLEVLPRIHAGMTELEAQAELIYCMYKNGAQGLSFDPIVVSGPNTSMPHGVAGDRVIREGDFVTMDFGVLYGGYCSDTTRTFAVGFATEEMKQVYNVVLEAQKTAIAMTRAGVTGSEIDGAARKVITDAGYGPYFSHSYGHSLGLEIHENPGIHGNNKEPLPAGVVASAEPGIYIPGKFGVRIEDVTILREDGCEDITGITRDLLVI